MNDTVAPAPAPQKRFYGWINAALLTFIYMATTGLVFYAFPVIFPVMLRDTGWSRGDASIAISVATLLGGFLVPLGAKLINKYGTRKVIIIGLALTLVNLFLLATVVSKLWHWIAIWGLAMPIGRMLCGVLPSQVNIMYWFNRKRAMAMGLLMIGAPIGGSYAPQLYTWFMKYTGGWRPAWLLSTGVLLVALLISFLIKSKPSDIGQYPDGIAPGTGVPGGQTGTSDEGLKTYRTNLVWTLKEVLKTRPIWFYYAAGISQSLTLGLVINHGVLHLRDIGYAPMQAAFIFSTIIISSGIVRFPVGWLGDRVESRWIYFSSLIFVLVGLFGIWKAPSYTLLLVFGPIYGAGYGSILVIGPTLLGNYYGPEIYPNIRAFFTPWLTVLSASVPVLAGYAQEKLGSYNEMFLVLFIMVAIGIVFSGFLAPPQKVVEE